MAGDDRKGHQLQKTAVIELAIAQKSDLRNTDFGSARDVSPF